MEKYPKLFIKSSLLYLGLGVLLGLHMAAADHNVNQIRFIHIHLLLLGFMAMMIYAVAYHILPRFNAVAIPYPRLVPVHFYLANIGLLGLVVLYAFGAFWAEGGIRHAFAFFGLIEVVGIFIFIINIFPVLSDPAPEEDEDETSTEPEPAQEPAPSKITLNPNDTVADILGKYPDVEPLFEEAGLGSIAGEAVRESVAKVVTLKMAAKQANLELVDVLAVLEGKRKVTTDSADSADDGTTQPDHYLKTGNGLTRGELATNDTQVGNLMEVYPETKIVFSRNYGEGCFTCPGQKTESVAQTAMMHGMPAEKILGEINEIIESL